MTPNSKTAKKQSSRLRLPAKKPTELQAIKQKLDMLATAQATNKTLIDELRGKLDTQMHNHSQRLDAHGMDINTLLSHKYNIAESLDYISKMREKLGTNEFGLPNYPVSVKTVLNATNAIGTPTFLMGMWGLTLGATAFFGVIHWYIPAGAVGFVGILTSTIATIIALGFGKPVIEEKDIK